MSGSKNVTPIYDTAIDKALLDVQNGFATNNPEYVYSMLHKLALVTANKDIIAEAEKFMKEVNKAIELRRLHDTYTQADKLRRMMEISNFLKLKNYEFLKMLMLQLNDHKLLTYSFGPRTRETGMKTVESKLKGLYDSDE